MTFELDAIMMFGGSPIGVIAPPVNMNTNLIHINTS